MLLCSCSTVYRFSKVYQFIAAGSSESHPTIYICNHRVFWHVYSPHDICYSKIWHAPPESVDHLGCFHHPFHPPFLQCLPLSPRVDCCRRWLLSQDLLLLLSYRCSYAFKMKRVWSKILIFNAHDRWFCPPENQWIPTYIELFQYLLCFCIDGPWSLGGRLIGHSYASDLHYHHQNAHLWCFAVGDEDYDNVAVARESSIL